MKKLLKFPLRIAAVPLIVLLLAFQLIGFVLVGLSFIVTNLLATVFLIGSVAGSIAGALSSMICQTVGLGVFFAFASHILIGFFVSVSLTENRNFAASISEWKSHTITGWSCNSR